MSLFQTILSHLEAAIFYIAIIVSHLEAEILHIPPSLRFFTVGAEPDQLFRQAVLFLVAPLHAFVTLPLMDVVGRRYNSQPTCRGLVQCGGVVFAVPCYDLVSYTYCKSTAYYCEVEITNRSVESIFSLIPGIWVVSCREVIYVLRSALVYEVQVRFCFLFLVSVQLSSITPLSSLTWSKKS